MGRAAGLLVSLVVLVDRIPIWVGKAPRRRGRPPVYSERLLLQALIVMIGRGLQTAWALLAFLQQLDPVAVRLRQGVTEGGRFPCRRTWERGLAGLPATVPGLRGCFARPGVALLAPWQAHGHAAAVASTMLRALGGVWHKQHRAPGVVPHTSIDTQAHGSQWGWHGWGEGWKLPLAVSAGRLWIPLGAELTPANVADNELAPRLLCELPFEVRQGLGDTHYNTPELRGQCAAPGRQLVATRRGPYPHRDGGVEGRRILHTLRSLAHEPYKGLFKNVFEWRGQRPVKGLNRCPLFAVGAVLVYQRVLLFQYEQGRTVGVGIKALLRAA